MTPDLVKLFSTFFNIGKMPLAPGSAASVAGVIICVLLSQHLGLFMLVFVLVTVIGFKVSGEMEKLMDEKDPSCIVIDEVSGVMLAFFLLPLKWPVIITAFFLFRAFDMFKIFPVNRLEELPGSKGIMLDDIFAGLYTNIVMHLAIKFSGVF